MFQDAPEYSRMLPNIPECSSMLQSIAGSIPGRRIVFRMTLAVLGRFRPSCGAWTERTNHNSQHDTHWILIPPGSIADSSGPFGSIMEPSGAFWSILEHGNILGNSGAFWSLRSVPGNDRKAGDELTGTAAKTLRRPGLQPTPALNPALRPSWNRSVFVERSRLHKSPQDDKSWSLAFLWSGCHRGDPGSIPGRRMVFKINPEDSTHDLLRVKQTS